MARAFTKIGQFEYQPAGDATTFVYYRGREIKGVTRHRIAAIIHGRFHRRTPDYWSTKTDSPRRLDRIQSNAAIVALRAGLLWCG